MKKNLNSLFDSQMFYYLFIDKISQPKFLATASRI
jgi:hypothetical protein